MTMFHWFAGLWGIVVISLFISAIRLSYNVEARSDALHNGTGLPRRAQMFHVIFNRGVARDPETQDLRRRMNGRLLLVAAAFAAFGIVMRFARLFE